MLLTHGGDLVVTRFAGSSIACMCSAIEIPDSTTAAALPSGGTTQFTGVIRSAGIAENAGAICAEQSYFGLQNLKVPVDRQ